MFLCLAALYPGRTLVPTQEVDTVWEEHILQKTQAYTKISTRLGGRFINHVGEMETLSNSDVEAVESLFDGMYSSVEELESALDLAFQQTKALAELHFGVDAFADKDSYPGACGLCRYSWLWHDLMS